MDTCRLSGRALQQGVVHAPAHADLTTWVNSRHSLHRGTCMQNE